MSIICKFNKIQQLNIKNSFISSTFLFSQLNIRKSFYSTDSEKTDTEITTKKERVFFNDQEEIDGFKVFDVYMKKKRPGFDLNKPRRAAFKKIEVDSFARYNKMSTDQDWTNVWPSAAIFKQCAVPLPVRQGYVKNDSENNGLPPEKYANAELLKIPNFLHLTPPHIKKHCAAIKQFCTKWPKELKTDKDCETHFPVEITTSTYIYDGPSIRDDRARVVTLKIKLSSLELDERSYNKLIKLAQHRYDPKTDILTIVADKCPYRRQNEDYANYLLTTLYFESKNIEEWEKEMTEDDMREFKWEQSKSKENILNIVANIKNLKDKENVANLNEVKNYKDNLTNIFNQGETENNLLLYKNSVLNMLKLKSV